MGRVNQGRRKPRHLEDDEQAALFHWAACARHQGRPLNLRMFAIPNGGRRNKPEAARLKKQGVRAGVADIFLHLPVAPYAGLFVELKVGTNKPTDKQTEFADDVREDGYATGVAYGWFKAREMILKYLEGKHAEQATG